MEKTAKMMLDLEMVNTLNAEGCPACGKKFSLGDTVVLACGAWEGRPKYIHENEAVYDTKTRTYVERRRYEAGLG
ncbi:MAG: hypothetical protein JRI76_07210 [Deltaproteobacteria bacterium]|nr:hypothetical protein [Deltaproteobacteria bacterium]MBW1955245.1 hypothetical protein [Deltaproteobacteria bacterium]MBW2041809.1 hypothetical protein [Deltaproteobacteria bacterium]MBW2132430.1 hypothetical protein [Deltaproteobacteria bacterium]